MIPTVTYAEVSGKWCNLKDGEGLQVACKINIREQKKMFKYIKTWIANYQWTMIAKILVMYFSIHKKFEL